MSAIRISAFIGEIPRLIARLLPETAAQIALDTRLEDGDLRPIRKSRTEFSDVSLPDTDPATIYKFDGDWLSWSARVNAAPGPVTEDRLYYTGDGLPKMYTAATEYNMKIVAPTVKLTVANDGAGAGDTVTRLYVYTNVSEFGEESEPSPISDPDTFQPGDNVTLSGFLTAMGDRTATLQRIYRSQTSLSGDTTLFFIDERAADTVDYIDLIDPSDIQEPLPSLDWNQPPDNLEGLIGLPNGIMAGFVGKDLYFSEPYFPHAYPQKYILTTDYAIVALGAYGNTIIVMTDGNPYVVQGTAPENMVMEKLELNLPCINPAGVVDLGYAIAYPSHEGLVVASSGGASIATKNLFTKTLWKRLSPETMVAGQYDGRYMASYEYTDASSNVFNGSIIIDLTGNQPFLIRSVEKALSFFYEITTGKLYYLKDKIIYEWDAEQQASRMQNWKSKEFVLPRPVSMSYIKIETNLGVLADEAAAIIADRAAALARNQAKMTLDSLGGELNGAEINAYGINDDDLEALPGLVGSATVLIYADGVQVASITETDKLARLPTGFKGIIWEVEVTSDIPISQITIAKDTASMKQVS